MLENNKKNLYKIKLGNSIDIYDKDCYDKCDATNCIKLDERRKLLSECLKCNMQKNKCYKKSVIGGTCDDCNIEKVEDKMNCYDTNNFGCAPTMNLDNNNGVIPYYLEVADNNTNSPYNKKCVFCWNIQDNI